MVYAGIKVPDTTTVREAVDLSRSLLEPFLFNHVMRSRLFGVLLSETADVAPDAELLAVAAILHDLGLTDRYTAENRFEVDGASAARAFLKDRGISAQQMQVVWDAIALHTTPTLALHKEPEVVMTHSGIAVDVLGAMVEDLHTAYWDEYEGGYQKSTTFIELCKNLIDELNADHIRDGLSPTEFTRSTLSMHLYDSVAVFEKGSHTRKLAPRIGRE
jgi:hypothetical protein